MESMYLYEIFSKHIHFLQKFEHSSQCINNGAIRIFTMDIEFNYTPLRIATNITYNREEIMKQKHKRANSIDVKQSSILFIDMNTIYNTSHRENLIGIGGIFVYHNKERPRLINLDRLHHITH